VCGAFLVGGVFGGCAGLPLVSLFFSPLFSYFFLTPPSLLDTSMDYFFAISPITAFFLFSSLTTLKVQFNQAGDFFLLGFSLPGSVSRDDFFPSRSVLFLPNAGELSDKARPGLLFRSDNPFSPCYAAYFRASIPHLKQYSPPPPP